MNSSRLLFAKLAGMTALLLTTSACYIQVGNQGFRGAVAPYQAHIGIVSFIVLCADIWACVRIWSSPGSTLSKLIWTGVVWLFPCGGVGLVWFFF
jgi:hypothetical protein